MNIHSAHHKKYKITLFLLIAVGFICSLYYFLWWFNFIKLAHWIFIIIFCGILFYIITQVYFVWYIYARIKYPQPKKVDKHYKVDVFLPTYNEPHQLVEKSLKAIQNIRYPHKTYLIDDGSNPAFQNLASQYGANYVTREDNYHNKAGNINNALNVSDGEIIAIFDMDHLPNPNFLDDVLGYFADLEVGVVQAKLDHYNASESYVATACYNMHNDFFNTIMMGMSGCNSAVVFGSNSVFRRKALNSIDGYKPGLAEDLNTSIHLHAEGWKSAYVFKTLALGLVPFDLKGFFVQQMKWARGIFEILLTIFPKLISRLKVNHIVCYLNRMTYYLAGTIILVHIILTLIALLSVELGLYFNSYLIHSLPFIFVFFVIHFYIRYVFKGQKSKTGFSLRGLFLALSSWPVYSLAFLSTLLRIKIPFKSTPKHVGSGNNLLIILPQALTAVLITFGIIYNIVIFKNMDFLPTLLFAVFLIILHSGVIWLYIEERKTKHLILSPEERTDAVS